MYTGFLTSIHFLFEYTQPTTQLGFDVDVLEVLLHELDNVSDKIFVMESTRTHNKGIRKALLWERLQDQPRFKIFQDKVVHLVLDDAEVFADPHWLPPLEASFSLGRRCLGLGRRGHTQHMDWLLSTNAGALKSLTKRPVAGAYMLPWCTGT